MNRIEFNEGGFPLHIDTLQYLQETYTESIAALTALGGGNYILTGCEIIGNAVSDGVVVINGELLPFKGGAKQLNVIVRESATQVKYEDLETKDAYFSRWVEFGTGADQIVWSSLKYIKNLQEIDAYFTSQLNDLSAIVDGKSVNGHKHVWADIDDKPLTFKPESHDHDGVYAKKNDTQTWTAKQTFSSGTLRISGNPGADRYLRCSNASGDAAWAIMPNFVVAADLNIKNGANIEPALEIQSSDDYPKYPNNPKILPWGYNTYLFNWNGYGDVRVYLPTVPDGVTGITVKIGTMGQNIDIVASADHKMKWDSQYVKESGHYNMDDENHWTWWTYVAGVWHLTNQGNY